MPGGCISVTEVWSSKTPGPQRDCWNVCCADWSRHQPRRLRHQATPPGSLRQFPFDTLKIDRSFISTNGDRRHHEIDDGSSTIANLTRILGMDVTVEGLESADQVQRMRDLGIDYAAKGSTSPPVDAREALAFLATSITYICEDQETLQPVTNSFIHLRNTNEG
jgi:hypothetical protein